jgi:hypothetical protein
LSQPALPLPYFAMTFSMSRTRSANVADPGSWSAKRSGLRAASVNCVSSHPKFAGNPEGGGPETRVLSGGEPRHIGVQGLRSLFQGIAHHSLADPVHRGKTTQFCRDCPRNGQGCPARLRV